MNKTISGLLAYVSTIFAGLSWVEEADMILKIVSSILSLVLSGISLYFLIKAWYNKAKADGKITKEEIEEGAKIAEHGVTDIKDGVDTITQTIEDSSKKDEGKK